MKERIERMQDNLATLRKSLGWSAADLGEKLGVTRQLISNIETKKARMTQIQYLAICKVCYDEIKEFEDETYMAYLLLDWVICEDYFWFDDEEQYESIMILIRSFAPGCMDKRQGGRAIVNKEFKEVMKLRGWDGFLDKCEE